MVFKGGIHPNYNKITSNKVIETAKIPSKIILPLSQHIGAPAEPIIKVGDYIKAGQKIAESCGFMSVPIHSSISGNVKSIESLPHPITGKNVKSIIIESDSKDEKIDTPNRDYEKLPVDEIKQIIKEAGIVGLGGASFPTHVKLSPPKNVVIDTLIINGAECEPYLTTDHRLMVEKSDSIIEGIRIIRKVLDVKSVIIGIEDNKDDALRILQKKAESQNIKVVSLKTKYPQGAEKMLIYTLTKRKVPPGKLPMDVGCVVHNIATIIAVLEAVAISKSLYERVITVTGKVKNPKNLLVRNGTLVKDLIAECNGYEGVPRKIILGGPLMGFSLPNDNFPVIKGTSGIVVLNDDDFDKSRSVIECIRCGKCVENCPMNLHPVLIAKYAEKAMFEKVSESYSRRMFEKTAELYALDCFECGCCAYNCPSHIPLVHYIKTAKAEICNNNKKKVCDEVAK
jgi:Na+-translocating ferredoxin:NAD+ oxidoreductase subunit C